MQPVGKHFSLTASVFIYSKPEPDQNLIPLMHKMSFHSNSRKCHTVSFYSDERLQYHRVSCFKNHVSVLFCFMSHVPTRLFQQARHTNPLSPRTRSSNQMRGWLIYLSLKDDLLSAIPINNRHVRMESAGGQSLMLTPPRQAARCCQHPHRLSVTMEHLQPGPEAIQNK